MRLLTIITGVILILGAAAAIAVRLPAVQDRLMDRAISKVFSSNPKALFDDDGLKIVFCGTSSPITSPKRAQACTAIIAGERFFLVDVGTGSVETLRQAGLPMERLSGIYLTHYHSDHIGDLGEAHLLSWIGGREGYLPVFGPSRAGDDESLVSKIVNGFDAAYRTDMEYRTAHHTKAVAPPRNAGFSTIGVPSDEATLVNKAYGVTVTAFPVDHDPASPAIGYRFDYQGRSVVVSGDTAYSLSLIEAAQGVDLLVHEAQANHMVAEMQAGAAKAGLAGTAKILADIQDYHTSPIDAAKAANEAGADWLVLTHLTPPPDNPVMRRIFMRGVSKVRSKNVKLAEDQMMIFLPKDSGVEFH